MRKILFLTLLLAACPRTEQSRQDSAFQRSISQISDSVIEASAQADRQDFYKVDARYNPAPCKCPPFEVYAYGRWMRTMFEGDPNALNGLAEFQAREKRAPSLSRFSLVGKFSDDLELGENQVRYPVFTLAAP